MAKINENEEKVLESLAELDEGYAKYFRAIVKETGLELKIVRRSCRSLKRKGLAEFMRGLFNEDGETAGSGYGCTPEGHKVCEEIEAKKKITQPALL